MAIFRLGKCIVPTKFVLTEGISASIPPRRPTPGPLAASAKFNSLPAFRFVLGGEFLDPTQVFRANGVSSLRLSFPFLLTPQWELAF